MNSDAHTINKLLKVNLVFLKPKISYPKARVAFTFNKIKFKINSNTSWNNIFS